MVKPFFSIVIPTFNRCADLKKAIKIILEQTFKDFELIISDNASTDETEKIVKAFKDKRIRYYRNPKNIGAEPNYKKVFSYATGKYLFTQGDDDLILFDNTLEKIKKILDKKSWGFVRPNLLEKTLDGKGLRKSFINKEEDFSLPKGASEEEIFNFLNLTAASHLAGLVIKNKKSFSDGLIDCVDVPWVKPLFEAVKADGGYFLSNEYMIITWCRVGQEMGASHYYDVPKSNRLMCEDYINLVLEMVPPEKRKVFGGNFYRKFILLQPVIKLYSGNNNLIKFDRRLLELAPDFKKRPEFWLMATLAFLGPKFLWEGVRILQHKQKNTFEKLLSKKLIGKRFNFLRGRN